MRKFRFFFLSLLILLIFQAVGGLAKEGVRPIYVISAVGSITPGLAEFIIDSIHRAEKDQAQALVIQLDTPGGLDASMRQINQSIVNSQVPVMVYVSPKGARAASA